MFGQSFPPGIVPHPSWGNSPASCFTNANPGTGGDAIFFPGSITGLVRTGTSDDSINRFADGVRNNFNPQNYDELPQVSKEALQVRADEVSGQLQNLSAKAELVKSEWLSYGSLIAQRDGDPRSSDAANAFANAQASLLELSNQKRTAFTNVDLLMVYSPTPRAAGAFCVEKLKAERSLAGTLNAVQDMNSKINTQVSEFFERRDEFLGTIETLLKLFLKAIEALIAIILQAFELASGFVIWLGAHPKIAITLGVVVGLGVLGFLLRPYLTIFKALTGG